MNSAVTTFAHNLSFLCPKKSSVKGLNDDQPVAPIVKCFEKIRNIIPPELQISRSTEDAGSNAHWTCTLGQTVQLRMLFIDFSSAFNTVVPHKLVYKLNTLGLNSSLCSWVRDLLVAQPQHVTVGKHSSSTLILNPGTPEGWVLSPMLHTLFTYVSPFAPQTP